MKGWKDYTFEDVWITDECMFQLNKHKAQVWSSKKCPRPTKAVPKFEQQIIIWESLSYWAFYSKIFVNSIIYFENEKDTNDSQKVTTF